jgi:hypothetical protein
MSRRTIGFKEDDLESFERGGVLRVLSFLEDVSVLIICDATGGCVK